MKLTVLQEELTVALATASRFVNTRAQLPVLGNLHLVASKTKLRINATNLENSISISLGAKVDKDGELAVPTRVLTDLVSGLPKGQVTLEAKNEKLTVTASGFRSNISAMLATDFPKVPVNVGSSSVEVDSISFLRTLSQVMYSTSTDETRPVLTGVLFIFGKRLTLVATDGFRLSKKKIEVTGKVKGSVIIPKNILGELVRVGKQADKIRLSIWNVDNQVVWGVGSATLASRIIDGSYPDFEKIIPKSGKIRVNVDKEELLRATKVSGVFARDSANVLKFILEKDSFTVTAESSKSGTQRMKLDSKITGVAGKLEIAFNYKFVEDFLQSIEGESVEIKLNDESSPGVFLDTSDQELLHLIMPVKS